MNDERKALSKKLMIDALKEYRSLFNKSPDDKAIDLYAEMLCTQFEFKQVTWALTEFIKKGSAFFPSCGEIFAQLKPEDPKKDEMAPVIVNEMIQAIRSFSQYDEVRMIESVSPHAKKAFAAMGSTADFRLSENFETSKAQLERLVRGILAVGEAEIKNEKLHNIGIDSPKVISLRKNEFRTTDYSGYLPENGA